jgi:hypothetical protein
MSKRRKTLARKLFVGLLMEATDDRVKDMHFIVDDFCKHSPITMTTLRIVPFVDDLIDIIDTEYKFRFKNKK